MTNLHDSLECRRVLIETIGGWQVWGPDRRSTWYRRDFEACNTPLQLIDELRPDILVKGGDYDMDKLPESAAVRSYGGTALSIPFVDGYSTSALVQKIRTR